MVENLKIQSHNDVNHKVDISLFIPQNITKSTLLMLYIHGGGFILPGTDDIPKKFIKENTLTVYVDYRLAPEYKHPLPLDDCYTTLLWIYQKDNKYLQNIDLSNLFLLGDSAGGNLVTALSLLARNNFEKDKLTIPRQVLIYPAMRVDFVTESWKKYSNGYIINAKASKEFMGACTDNIKRDYEDPYFAPMKSPNNENLPKTLFILGNYDPLLTEGTLYYELLKSNKNDVEIKYYNDVHGFFSFPYGESRKAFLDVIQYLRFFNKSI